MDPNATFQRIMDAINDSDADEFVSAFQDLADCLAKGGFSPNVKSLGKTRRRIGHSHNWQFETVNRRTLTDRPFKSFGETHTIQTVDPNSDGPPFEFITYRGEKRIARYLLT